mmetsp:Transcript_42949/g.138060  ORF Transcript_42949/g.138060 Transcript_42949/m.138060 type:complete len:180 (+) Transcript_42949:1082-1621(+)
MGLGHRPGPALRRQAFQVYREFDRWFARLTPGRGPGGPQRIGRGRARSVASPDGSLGRGSMGRAETLRSGVARSGLFTPPGAPGTPTSTRTGPVAKQTFLTVGDWAREQKARFKGMAKLPEGWLRAISRSSGQIYHVNQRTGGTQYNEPTKPAEGGLSPSPSLPRPSPSPSLPRLPRRG